MPNNFANYHCRWGTRRDLPALMDAEASLEDPWTAEDYLAALRQRDCISLVVEGRYDERPVGGMMYQLFPTHLKLLRFVVHPNHRRQGVGQALMAKLAYKVVSHRREGVYARVAEANLGLQLFLRACAFRAVAMINAEYLMEFRPAPVIYRNLGIEPPVNRTAHHYEET